MRSALIAPGRDFLKSRGRNRPLAGSTAGRTLIQLTPQISGKAPDGMTADIRTKPGVRP